MKVLSGPYGTILEFQHANQAIPSLSNMEKKYASKRWSFYPALVPEWQEALYGIAEQYCQSPVDILVTPTYRGWYLYKRDAVDNELCITLSGHISKEIRKIADRYTIPLRGSIGPIWDSYTTEWSPSSVEEAKDKHEPHIAALLDAKVDSIIFETAVRKEEILAILQLCEKRQTPAVISFYVDDKGLIPEPNGAQTLDEMMSYLDSQSSYNQVKFGINCASKDAIDKACKQALHTKDRIQVLYPNASQHTACELHTAHKSGEALPAFIQHMKNILPNLETVWGCCGYTPRDTALLKQEIEKMVLAQ